MEFFSAKSLIEFESRIADFFDSGTIPHPVHLTSGNEDSLVNIFKSINDEDWVF
jgi:TPP-dependent pyruvate/acetoin dehydrogenase alpha subunit